MIPNALKSEIDLRTKKMASLLLAQNIDAILVSDNANLYYTSGRVYSGYAYITNKGEVTYFVKRPVGLKGDNVKYIRKPEQIADMLDSQPAVIALEQDVTSYSEIMRLSNVFPEATVVNGSGIMRSARAVKTAFEIAKIKESGVHHDMAYRSIKKVYREGMTDIEMQIEMERVLRSEGCLGQFRVSGGSMELFMGNLLCGDNADNATPYDFAMGGAGLDSSLPVGSNGTEIKPGMTLMVDMCGNFNGYMTDMTRVFYVGNLDTTARRAHELSISIHHRLSKEGKAGVPAKRLYEIAVEMVQKAGLEDFFMGHNQKAGFIGHGVGIEINESPVLAPRSRDILEEGNVIAIEPKFVIPHVGAVGMESTYVVRKDRLECVTNFPEEIAELY